MGVNAVRNSERVLFRKGGYMVNSLSFWFRFHIITNPINKKHVASSQVDCISTPWRLHTQYYTSRCCNVWAGEESKFRFVCKWPSEWCIILSKIWLDKTVMMVHWTKHVFICSVLSWKISLRMNAEMKTGQAESLLRGNVLPRCISSRQTSRWPFAWK